MNELLPYSTIDFVSLFNKLLNDNDHFQPNKIENVSFVKYDSMIEMLPQNQVAYICNQSLSVYKFSMESMQGKFGFVDKENSSPSSAVLFDCNEKMCHV